VGKGRAQLALCCPCGRAEALALGLCPTCYTLKRQDEEYFGGLREAVLERDGYRCRGCRAPGREKRSLIVHHRAPPDLSVWAAADNGARKHSVVRYCRVSSKF
jgi:5-methylcytosine-specific restriction endonuclease McrA